MVIKDLEPAPAAAFDALLVDDAETVRILARERVPHMGRFAEEGEIAFEDDAVAVPGGRGAAVDAHQIVDRDVGPAGFDDAVAEIAAGLRAMRVAVADLEPGAAHRR